MSGNSDGDSIARREFLKNSMLAGSGILIGSRLLTAGDAVKRWQCKHRKPLR